MFCIKCGRPAVVENFCDTCFLDSQSLFEVKDFSMIFCNVCGVNEEEIREKIERTIKSKNPMTVRSLSLKIFGNQVRATITGEGRIEGLPKTETKKILVMLKKKMCDMHVKLSGGYYEAVIQIRGTEKEKILKYAMRFLPKKGITSIDSLSEGYNIKVMRKTNASAAAKILRKWFDVKESYKLGGSRKGQKLYRNFYAIR